MACQTDGIDRLRVARRLDRPIARIVHSERTRYSTAADALSRLHVNCLSTTYTFYSRVIAVPSLAYMYLFHSL